MSQLKDPTKLELFALQLAIEAPLKQYKYTRNATVTWRTVNKLRDALRERRIDDLAKQRRRRIR